MLVVRLQYLGFYNSNVYLLQTDENTSRIFGLPNFFLLNPCQKCWWLRKGGTILNMKQNRILCLMFLVCWVDIAYADLGKLDTWVWIIPLNVFRLSRVSWAGSAVDARLSWIGIQRVVRVQPEHIDGMVIPQTHHQNHAILHLLPKPPNSSQFSVVVIISKEFLDGRTKIVRHRVKSIDSFKVNLFWRWFEIELGL